MAITDRDKALFEAIELVQLYLYWKETTKINVGKCSATSHRDEAPFEVIELVQFTKYYRTDLRYRSSTFERVKGNTGTALVDSASLERPLISCSSCCFWTTMKDFLDELAGSSPSESLWYAETKCSPLLATFEDSGFKLAVFLSEKLIGAVLLLLVLSQLLPLLPIPVSLAFIWIISLLLGMAHHIVEVGEQDFWTGSNTWNKNRFKTSLKLCLLFQLIQSNFR